MSTSDECPHLESELRKRTKANKSVVVCRQCMSCGRSLGEVPKNSVNIDMLSEFDPAINIGWMAIQNEQWQSEKKKADEQQERREGDWWIRYNDYLSGAHWYHIRRVVLGRDVICQSCLKNRATEAHHLTYQSFNRWGMSFANECVGLCKSCHEELHGRNLGALYGDF